MKFLASLALLCGTANAKVNGLAKTPPMGWMSWEIFRCDLQAPGDDCTDKGTTMCVSQALYEAAGYASIHMDDCWEQKDPPRDPTSGRLRANATRFPGGMKALGQYIHGKKLGFAIYTAESSETCGGYPASATHEQLDAKTFADWEIDYIKVDGCGPANYYPEGYKAMGAALQATGRDIVYSCSWPAYIGANESIKPFGTFIQDGCNLWRNYDDIQCNWGSLSGIIDHWGDYGPVIARFAGPSHWNDPDMLLIGNGCVTEAEERTQMAIWSLIAAPLIMGNDMRNVSQHSKDTLFNKGAIAINQDPMGQQGLRLDAPGQAAGGAGQQVWARNLADGSVAVGLYNKQGAAPPPIPGPPCKEWTHTTDGYYEACGGAAGDVGTFTQLTVAQAQAACCSNAECAGFSYDRASLSGYYKGNAQCGLTKSPAYDGYTKPSQVPPASGVAADITVTFLDVGLEGEVEVFDVWAGKSLGSFTGSYTAKAVAFHDTALLRLSAAASSSSSSSPSAARHHQASSSWWAKAVSRGLTVFSPASNTESTTGPL